MSEPTYEYIKGKGWVIRTFVSITCVDRDGKTVRLEYRTPENGEHFFYGYRNEKDRSHMKRFRRLEFSQWNGSWAVDDRLVVIVEV